MADVLTIEAQDRTYRIVDPGGRVGSKLVNGEPYERRLLADVHRRGLSGSAFDVGAHVGNHSLYLAAVCGLKVYAFEPHPVTYGMLVENLNLNPSLDITPLHVAAGDRSGRARFASRMQLKLERGHVPVQRIDDLVNVDDLSVVKVDVEGMEPEALAGMSAHLVRCRPVVYVETHTKTADLRTGEVLEPLGFRRTGTISMGSVMRVWEAK